MDPNHSVIKGLHSICMLFSSELLIDNNMSDGLVWINNWIIKKKSKLKKCFSQTSLGFNPSSML